MILLLNGLADRHWDVYTSVCVVSYHPVNFHSVKSLHKNGYLTRVIAK